MDIMEKVLGAEHPDTASSLNNLASLYQVQGKYEQAEPLFLRALDIRVKTVGMKHPRTVKAISGLVELYDKLGLPEKFVQYKAMLSKEEDIKDS